ncbi:DNA-processing protein DprA [Specibacter cremeus]|uniref:DNA-processing protein DprA n=1 Tax=Specibacter cremeus TaxID=1629051 RepID=UPI000F77D314|nr:DNA-processing protein DprA [Specibacter cremeus]
MEPADLPGLALVRAAGPVEALAFIRGSAAGSPELERAMSAVLADAGVPRWPGLADALTRWRPRVGDLAPERDLAMIGRLGGTLLIPEDDAWPAALGDLELAAPIALWLRGRLRELPPLERCVAVVGSRDSTAYGANVAGEVAHGLVGRGFTVISGGAYGIDAHAHRGALGGNPGRWPATVAIMAGGLDRFYPAGNEELLRAVADAGALVAEVPPGTNPTRYRFLQRNRLIAALAAATVVVEARWRSGALNTAHHADALSRPVGAVPGSVYSANSAGCHRILREGSAVCVTDVAEVAELAGAAGSNLAAEPVGAAARHDGLAVEDLLLMDALPVASVTTPQKLCSVAGLGLPAVLAGLGRLEVMGLAERGGAGWRRKR